MDNNSDKKRLYSFNAEKSALDCVKWVQNWFERNGPGCSAIVGISGGKDSSVAAAICVRALGKERVFGVMMPQGIQSDIDYSVLLCDHLGIERITVNIGQAVDCLLGELDPKLDISRNTRINLPPRIRMATLYAVAQSKNGRVVNTCNKSEDYVGYSTRYGDSVGDFSPLSNFTVREVKEIGRFLGLPEALIEKPPIDGLSGKTDEDNLGFTYEELDRYIREGIDPPAEKKAKIDRLHKQNLFKLELMESFPFEP